jgi:hypothetical protein
VHAFIKTHRSDQSPAHERRDHNSTRFKIDCRVKPIARRSRGRESPITAKIAGDAMLCQPSRGETEQNKRPRSTEKVNDVTERASVNEDQESSAPSKTISNKAAGYW